MEKRERNRDGSDNAAPRRKPLRDEVVEIDREILRLLIKRNNLLERMKNRKGSLEAAEEKFLREAWQDGVARVSRDATLSGHFFSLLQQISFLPRPEKVPAAGDAPKGADRRQAFNLAPPRAAVKIGIDAPASSFSASSWLYLAAASGAAAELCNCLMNDGEVDLAKSLGQIGGAISREAGKIICRRAIPLAAPDKVLHLGGCHYNLYLLVAHYLGRPSRVKLSGDACLKLADLSFLHPFLLQCGARLVHIVPKSAGLPARLECSGMLPPGIEFAADLPAELACALLLAATCWKQPFSLDLRGHPMRRAIHARVVPILAEAGALFRTDGWAIAIEPSPLIIPPKPAMPVEPLLAAALLAFAIPYGGSVRLGGTWPDWPECEALWKLLLAMGLPAEKDASSLWIDTGAGNAPISPASLEASLTAGLDEEFLPLPIALAAIGTFMGRSEAFPAAWPLKADTGDFMRSLGLEADENGCLHAPVQDHNAAPIFNAPAASWALALALAAMSAKSQGHGTLLGNPGIMTSLWPGFWSLYNSLPVPASKVRGDAQAAPPARRRRILADSTPSASEQEDDS